MTNQVTQCAGGGKSAEAYQTLKRGREWELSCRANVTLEQKALGRRYWNFDHAEICQSCYRRSGGYVTA